MTDMKSITIEDLKRWNACYYRDKDAEMIELIERVFANSLTVEQVLRCEELSAMDRLWVVLREEVLPVEILSEAGCRFTESVLPIWVAKYPDDDCLQRAIAAKRAYMRGEITKQELDNARNAAYSIPVSHAYAADVAEAAYSASADVADVAYAADAAFAARYATAADDREKQVEILLELLREKGAK